MVLHSWCSRLRWMVSSITVRYSAAFIYLSILLISAAAKFKRLYLSHIQKLFIIDDTRFSVTRENFRQEAAGGNERLEELKAFVQFLEDRCGFVFDINNFEHRIILQKCVYVAKLLGWECPHYSYNIYMRGPYSPSLADDYYDLSRAATRREDVRDNEDLLKFDKENFVRIIQAISGKWVAWLEVGTTLSSLYEANKFRLNPDVMDEFLIDRTCEIKSEYPTKFINGVLRDIKKYNLIR